MARTLYTVQDLIDQVRSQIDEENQDTIDDTADILPALNRAQDYATSTLARRYEDPLLKLASLDVISGQREYAIPEDCYEDRLEKVEISIGQDKYEVQRISYRDISDYEASIQVNIPRYYAVKGRKFRLVPTPSGTYDGRIWYLKQPDSLVKPQGRITQVNTASNYVVVDSLGLDLSTESDDLANYVNLVDGQTGLVKGTLQIGRTTGTRITFKALPDRTTVLNRTVVGSMASLADPDAGPEETTTVSIEPDDYVCLVTGSCVLSFVNPVNNFIIQYAVSEMRRKVGSGTAGMEEQVLQKFEKQVERTWAGREQQLRVQKRSKNWDRSRRRWPYSQG